MKHIHTLKRSITNKGLIFLDANVSSILNLGTSNGRPLGFYLPPGTEPRNIGLEEQNALLHRDFSSSDPRVNKRTQEIHKNDLDYVRRNQHRSVPAEQFYRLLTFAEGPQAFTRLYNNNRTNITPINGGFGGTFVVPSYTRYHSAPSNNLIKKY